MAQLAPHVCVTIAQVCMGVPRGLGKPCTGSLVCAHFDASAITMVSLAHGICHHAQLQRVAQLVMQRFAMRLPEPGDAKHMQHLCMLTFHAHRCGTERLARRPSVQLPGILDPCGRAILGQSSAQPAACE